jgi:hypothetical protein
MCYIIRGLCRHSGNVALLHASAQQYEHRLSRHSGIYLVDAVDHHRLVLLYDPGLGSSVDREPDGLREPIGNTRLLFGHQYRWHSAFDLPVLWERCTPCRRILDHIALFSDTTQFFRALMMYEKRSMWMILPGAIYISYLGEWAH